MLLTVMAFAYVYMFKGCYMFHINEGGLLRVHYINIGFQSTINK